MESEYNIPHKFSVGDLFSVKGSDNTERVLIALEEYDGYGKRFDTAYIAPLKKVVGGIFSVDELDHIRHFGDPFYYFYREEQSGRLAVLETDIEPLFTQ